MTQQRNISQKDFNANSFRKNSNFYKNEQYNNCVSVCNVIASCQKGSSAASSREQSKLSSICIRLLDPASTGAFITRQTMKKLGIEGVKTHLQLSTMNGTEFTTT